MMLTNLVIAIREDNQYNGWREVNRCVKTQGMVQAWVAHFVTHLQCTYNEYN